QNEIKSVTEHRTTSVSESFGIATTRHWESWRHSLTCSVVPFHLNLRQCLNSAEQRKRQRTGLSARPPHTPPPPEAGPLLLRKQLVQHPTRRHRRLVETHTDRVVQRLLDSCHRRHNRHLAHTPH